jgi:hypothetical protein
MLAPAARQVGSQLDFGHNERVTRANGEAFSLATSGRVNDEGDARGGALLGQERVTGILLRRPIIDDHVLHQWPPLLDNVVAAWLLREEPHQAHKKARQASLT